MHDRPRGHTFGEIEEVRTVMSRTLTAVAAGFLALAGAGVLAAGAGAEINGPCTASIAGTNVKGLGATSAGDAIPVKSDARIPVTMASSKDIDQLQVTIALAGLSYDAKNGPANGTSWVRTVNVNDYAKWGVGLYQVTGSSTGSGLSCSGIALVRVEGNPLTKPAGWAGIGLSALGALGLVGVALSALHGGGLLSRSVLGLLAGLATALGVTVLLQQYSVLYPTESIAGLALALGAIVGVGLPLVMHAIGAHGAHAGAAPPVAHA
jgi:hypothetical protein